MLANLYLDPLDHAMAAEGFEMVRYADDLVVLCRTAEDAQRALTMVRRWTQTAGLQLHPQKTRVVDMQQPGGFDFLGYHFERDRRWPRQKSRVQLKDTLRAKTRRNHGHSLAVIIADVIRTLRGWFEYFKHSHGTFKSEDAWVRMRLRAILRRRRGKGYHPDWRDHRRWPNAFFTAQGLCSLERVSIHQGFGFFTGRHGGAETKGWGAGVPPGQGEEREVTNEGHRQFTGCPSFLTSRPSPMPPEAAPALSPMEPHGPHVENDAQASASPCEKS